MNVLINGCDYKHLLEKRPDFLLAGEFSQFGQSIICHFGRLLPVAARCHAYTGKD
jgi:hypothetical protein